MESGQPAGGKRESFPQRSIHLVTWSQADFSLLKNPEEPRTSFASQVVDLFESKLGTKCKLPDGEKLVDRWACSLEEHADGGEHLHMLIRSTHRVRPFEVWQFLFNQGIKVNFSDSPGTYWAAFGYISKNDTCVKLSENHPVLGGASNQELQGQSQAPGTGKSTSVKRPRKSLQEHNLEIRTIILQNNIKDDEELCAFANRMEEEGNMTVTNWVLANRKKSLRLDMINTVWELKEAPEKIKRRSQLQVCLIGYQCFRFDF